MGGVSESRVVGDREKGYGTAHVTRHGIAGAQEVRWPNFLLPSPSSGRGGEPLRRRDGGGWRAGHAR